MPQIHAVADSDREAFLGALYAEHGPALTFFVMRLNGGDRHSAEDVLQETMLRAWRNSDTLRGSGRSPRPWLFAVARRLVIDAKRNRDTRPPEVPFTLSAPPFVEEGFETIEARDEVMRALWLLTPAQREIIVCVHYLGLSVAETSRALGLPLGTVKSRTYHVVRALRDQLLPGRQSDGTFTV
jgi:RNA polymerase sigma-70 factor (ECF subfamily)